VEQGSVAVQGAFDGGQVGGQRVVLERERDGLGGLDRHRVIASQGQVGRDASASAA
jgi:hypothetical protein